MDAEIYYFGCHGGPGHYLWDKNLRHAWRTPTPWGQRLDACLCPGVERVERPSGVMIRTPRDQSEGLAALHHKDGWTALSFWDRSVDTRGGCNSAFVAKGTHTFEQMTAMAREAFPGIWGRFEFEVRLA